MWPWQRVRHAEPPAERRAVDAVPPRPGWTAVAPIQRSFDTLRPVSPRQEFADSLVSWHNPSFLAPLGHVVSPDAPAGVIHRLIEPAAPPAERSAGAPPAFGVAPQRPRRDSVVQRMLTAVTPWVRQEDPPPPPIPGSGASRESLSPPLPPQPQETDPVGPPAVQAVPVQRSVPDPPPMTQASPPALPVLELLVQSTGTETAGQSEPDDADGVSPATVEPPSPAARDEPEAPTLGMELPPSETRPTVVDCGVSGPADAMNGHANAPAPEASGRSATRQPTVQRRVAVDPTPHTAPPATATGDAGASRQFGLGPPLIPDAETAPRVSASPGARPPVAAPPPPPQRMDAPELQGAGPVEGTAHGDSPSSAEEIAPLLGEPGSTVVQREATASGEPVPRTAESASPPPAMPAAAEHHPLGPVGVTSPGAPATGSALPVPPVLRVHDSAAPPSTPAPPSSTAPLDATTTAPPVPVVPARPVVTRLVGDRTPPLLAAPSEPSGREQANGSVDELTPAGATNVAQRLTPDTPLRAAGYPGGAPGPLPVQLTPVVGHTAAAVQAASRHAPVLQTAPLETAPPEIVPAEGAAASGTPEQDVAPDTGTEVASEPGAVGPPESASAIPPADAPAPPGAPGGAGNPDELVKKLFDPLLRRLKTELRLDRERRGVLTDLRH